MVLVFDFCMCNFANLLLPAKWIIYDIYLCHRLLKLLRWLTLDRKTNIQNRILLQGEPSQTQPNLPSTSQANPTKTSAISEKLQESSEEILVNTLHAKAVIIYRNQSIDLFSKSFDRFLHDGNFGVNWVKPI